ncbi:MAG TPA: LytTR family DNA-binding domain-containing protein [Chitinophagaceae bacterium]|nr:LytTR family DNA-binding domain-containing protein [Chitinophagaceae bacterium]
MDTIQSTANYEHELKRVVLSTSKGILFIPVQQIIRIQSVSNYSKLILTTGKTIVISKLLRWFEEHPKLQSFVRIHRTHLVNIHYIKKYRAGKKSMLFLNNGETIAVARRKKAVLVSRFHHHD